MVKLIYIGGYGHSGSTLLEYLMTGAPGLVACGEVAEARRSDATSRNCTCGRPVPNCAIWSSIVGDDLPAKNYDHAALDAILLRHIAGRYSAMVDSTKTAWRASAVPFRLRRELGAGVSLVHIVRDPRAVCWSLLKRARRVRGSPNERLLAIETLVGWYFANISCELFARRYPDQYVRLRYEDLVAGPVETMTALMEKVLPSSGWNFCSIGAQDNRHQLYANRMRTEALTLETIKLDDAWQHEMPSRVRAFVQALSTPLRARYGYDA